MATRRPTLPGLSQSQRELMEIVWECGEVSAVDAREIISKKRDLTKNTARTFLDRTEKRGWLKHREDGRTYLYSAAQPGEASIEQKVLVGVRPVAGGTRNCLAGLSGLSPQEFKRIRAMLDGQINQTPSI